MFTIMHICSTFIKQNAPFPNPCFIHYNLTINFIYLSINFNRPNFFYIKKTWQYTLYTSWNFYFLIHFEKHGKHSIRTSTQCHSLAQTELVVVGVQWCSNNGWQQMWCMPQPNILYFLYGPYSNEVWVDALSWCKFQELFAHSYSFFPDTIDIWLLGNSLYWQ